MKTVNLSKSLKEQQTDKLLLQTIAASADSEAFLILYNRYSQRILRYFYQATDHEDTALDLSQNFWLYIWQNASRLIYEHMDSAESLFFHIAVKRVVDYYRSSKYGKEVPLDDVPYLSESDSSPSSPESDCHAEEIRRITEQVLSEYPELDQQIFICQKELDYPARQTAEQFNIGMESIYKKVSVIMKKLRSRLKQAGYCYSLLSLLGSCCLLQIDVI